MRLPSAWRQWKCSGKTSSSKRGRDPGRSRSMMSVFCSMRSMRPMPPSPRALPSRSGWRRSDLPHLLVDRFPGRLSIDPFAPGQTLPSVAEMSQVLRLLVALGAQGVNAVLPHLESKFPVHRLLATLFFAQVVSGKAFARLIRRLFDDEPRVRESCCRCSVRGYRVISKATKTASAKWRERLQRSGLPNLRFGQSKFSVGCATRRRFPASLPWLATSGPEVANSALGALMRLSAQDFGHNPKRWTEWWVEHSDQPREQWLHRRPAQGRNRSCG